MLEIRKRKMYFCVPQKLSRLPHPEDAEGKERYSQLITLIWHEEKRYT